ncbi:MAG: BON domain-containing protein, partial [Burkholderiales bacterium]|nr:BON domain-containing protein [Burkholderiales bacterium]
MCMNKVITTFARTALALGLMANLSACVEMAVGSAVVGSIAAADRRTLGAQTEDKSIVFKGETQLPKVIGEAGHVNVNAYNRRVLLTGEVKDEAMRAQAEREIRAIEEVREVINYLEVSGVSSLTSRSSDTLITTRVKASIINSKDVYANSVKIVTERGTVYLLGRVTQREGTQLAELARTVSGVQKVVKVFEEISEEEVKKY